MKSNVAYNQFYIWPDGTVDDICPACGLQTEYLKKGHYASGTVEDWLDKDSFVIGDPHHDQLYVATTYTTKTDPGPGDLTTGRNETPILPETGERESWNAVAAPDHHSVAFISRPSSGTQPPSLFVTDRNGSAIKKVDTSYEFIGDDRYNVQLLGWF